MKTKLQSLFVALAVLAAINHAIAQGSTAFTYQGQLRDSGTNANGSYTMIFKLYDAVTSGNQIGSTFTDSPTLVNGLFTVNLDFGNAFDGSARWLDITVTNGATTQELTPRVQVLPTPYAQFAAVAATVTNGAIMNAQIAANAVAMTNIQNGAITTPLIANGAVSNQNLSANAVNATNIASGQVVKSLSGFKDAVNLYPGENITFFYNPTTGYNITNGFVIAASPIPNISAFNSSGTFIVPVGVTRIEVEMWGAGGGGGAGYYYDDGMGDITSSTGGGGGAGAYTFNVFTVIPGASFSVTVPGSTAAGESGGGASFGALMSAGGGQAGADGVGNDNGHGGAKGTAAGGIFSTGDSGQSGGQNIGGQGGGVWRGSPGSYYGGIAISGPGGGGSGGGPGSPGFGGNGGAVIVYY